MYMYIKIPLKPICKKNNMRIITVAGHARLVQSKAYKKYERDVKPYLRPLAEPIDHAVNVKYTYWIHKNKDGSIPKTQIDLTNLMSATDDLLVKYGILKDDNILILAAHDGSRAYYIGHEFEECTEIEITEEVPDFSRKATPDQVPQIQQGGSLLLQ